MRSSKKKDTPAVKDDPGTEERFKGILKRVLSTPPSRKQKPAKRKPRPKS